MQLKKIIRYFSAKPKAEIQPASLINKLLVAQKKVADFLNRKTAAWSPLKIKIMLMLFCLLTGNMILFIAGRAILSANGPPAAVKVQRLAMPPPLPLPGRMGLHAADSLPKKLIH